MRIISRAAVFYVTNILNHRFHGSRMDSTEVAIGLSYIHESFQNLIPELTSYLAQFAPYHGYRFEDDYKIIAPGAWWG